VAAIAGAFAATWLIAGASWAQSVDSPPIATKTTVTDSGDVLEIVVQVARNAVRAATPALVSQGEAEPQSLVGQSFLDQGRPETGDYGSAALLAPSIASVSSNGGGVGESSNLSLRGLPDGQFTVTYDQISFGDTVSATHHPNAYFPAPTIASLVVDRGPGAAGDLGQVNYGGAIHLLSPTVNDCASLIERATAASFGTVDSVTTIQSGALTPLGGTKLLLDADYRSSSGELSYSGGTSEAYLFKSITPLPGPWRLTLFSAVHTTQFFQFAAGPRETWAQFKAFGPDYALTDNPAQSRYKGYNSQHENTDFEYADLKRTTADFSIDNRMYTYFYSVKLVAPNSIAVVDTSATSGVLSPKNASPPLDVTATDPAANVGGLHKDDRYRVEGDIVRLSKDFASVSFKIGAWYEHADTYRRTLAFDLTNGVADLGYASLSTPPIAHRSNIKTLEYSSWDQYQVFADIDWRPAPNVSIRPGFKYLDFARTIDAPVENGGVDGFSRGAAYGTNVFSLPLYFLTANYRVLPHWSIYGQYGTGFMIPPLSDLITAVPSLNHDAPPVTATYQVGTVWTASRLAFDADIYLIKIRHAQVPDPNNPYDIDVGTARYSGLEAELAYGLQSGFSLFANGSENVAKDTTHDLALDPNGGKALTNAPKATAALGALYHKHRWGGSLTFKLVGPQVARYNTNGLALELPRYSTLDSSISYDFGRLKAKLAVFNMLDDRAITVFAGQGPLYSSQSMGLYQFQSGRDIQATLEARF
jgi:iron complex outermembrane receptor protein